MKAVIEIPDDTQAVSITMIRTPAEAAGVKVDVRLMSRAELEQYEESQAVQYFRGTGGYDN